MYKGERMAMPATEHERLGSLAIGSIGPDARIENGEIQAETVDEVVSRLKVGEFYVPVDAEHGPNAAGGTFSLVIADALTTSRFMPADATTAAEHAESLFDWLIENKNDDASKKIIPRVCIDGRPPVAGAAVNDLPVGGHDAENNKAGCGAQASLKNILTFMSNNGENIRSFLHALGVEVDQKTSDEICAKARELVDRGYASTGEEIREAYVKSAGETSVTTLAGTHTEITGRINTNPQITLDRVALEAEYGKAYEAFNIDAGVFPAAAEVISLTVDEAQKKTTALFYYNVATTLVLADESLRL